MNTVVGRPAMCSPSERSKKKKRKNYVIGNWEAFVLPQSREVMDGSIYHFSRCFLESPLNCKTQIIVWVLLFGQKVFVTFQNPHPFDQILSRIPTLLGTNVNATRSLHASMAGVDDANFWPQPKNRKHFFLSIFFFLLNKICLERAFCSDISFSVCLVLYLFFLVFFFLVLYLRLPR